MGNLLVFSSLDTNFRGLCDCYFTPALQFLVGTQDISIHTPSLGITIGVEAVEVAFKFVAGDEVGEVTLQLVL